MKEINASFVVHCILHLFSSSPVELHKILAYIHQLPPVEKEEDCISDADYLLELLISRHEKRKSQQERVNEMPLYPTEKIIWDENIVPVEYFSGEGITSIWKYNFGNLMIFFYKFDTIYRIYDVDFYHQRQMKEYFSL